MTLHRYSVWMAVCVFFLLNTGALVTSTYSGLSVPDWPLSFGGFFPRMVGGVLFEHGHRLTALAILLLTAGLVAWTYRSGQPGVLKKLASAAAVAVVLQALLGGLTVMLKLPVAVSAGHAGLAQAFFCLVLAFALLSSPGWEARKGRKPAGGVALPLTWVTVSVVYLQVLLGAVIRHEYVGLAIPDFPLSLGRIIPPLDSWMVALNFAHRVTALLILLLAMAAAGRALALGAGKWVAVPAAFLASAVVLQVLLGAFTIWTARNPWVATAHVAGGALVLGSSVILALRLHRI